MAAQPRYDKTIAIKISDEISEFIDRAAAERACSRASVIRKALIDAKRWIGRSDQDRDRGHSLTITNTGATTVPGQWHRKRHMSNIADADRGRWHHQRWRRCGTDVTTWPCWVVPRRASMPAQ